MTGKSNLFYCKDGWETIRKDPIVISFKHFRRAGDKKGVVRLFCSLMGQNFLNAWPWEIGNKHRGVKRKEKPKRRLVHLTPGATGEEGTTLNDEASSLPSLCEGGGKGCNMLRSRTPTMRAYFVGTGAESEAKEEFQQDVKRRFVTSKKKRRAVAKDTCGGAKRFPNWETRPSKAKDRCPLRFQG